MVVATKRYIVRKHLDVTVETKAQYIKEVNVLVNVVVWTETRVSLFRS